MTWSIIKAAHYRKMKIQSGVSPWGEMETRAGTEGRDGRPGNLLLALQESPSPAEHPGGPQRQCGRVPVRGVPAQCCLEGLPPPRTGQHQKAPNPMKTQVWGDMGAGEDRWDQPGRRWGCWDCSGGHRLRHGTPPTLVCNSGPGGLSAPWRESSSSWAGPRPLN